MSDTDPTRPLAARLAEAEQRAAYFERQCERLGAQVTRADAEASRLRHELERKRRGFALLARLAGSLEGGGSLRELFTLSCGQLNGMLIMERTALLEPAGDGRRFRPSLLQGYAPGEAQRLACALVEPPPALCGGGDGLLVNGACPRDAAIAEFSDALALPFFVAVPIAPDGRVEAILVTGRTREQRLYAPPLEPGDLETLRAVGGFLGALLAREHLREMRHRAVTDSLTGIYNKRHLMEHGERFLAECEGPHALLVVDVDHFKRINDRFGHLAGDRVLEALGRLLRELFPDERRGLLFRFGGEEFIVLLRGADANEAQVIAETLRARAALLRPSEIAFTVSIGIAAGSAPFSLGQLIARADDALYAAKRAGRNRAVCAGAPGDSAVGGRW